MDENKTYSAEDLLRYAHGQMPMAERHALEKAALDDVFLGEALEGYLESVNGSMDGVLGNLPPQLNELKKIIADKADDKKEEKLLPVVSIFRNKWLQSAVAAMLIFGVAWWFYSISNRPKADLNVADKQIAQVQPSVIADSVMADTTPKKDQEQNNVIINPAPKQERAKVLTDKQVQQNKAVSGEANNNDVAVNPGKTASANAPVVMSESPASSSKDMALSEVTISQSKDFKKANESKLSVVGYGTKRKAEGELQNVTLSKKPTFVFQGRILDANHTPLPFSSIMVPGEDFGTYSDGEGYFNFVYTDSILPVRAKSIGFETQNFNMRANEKENRIVLNEDKNLDKSLTFLRTEKLKTKADFKPTIVKVDTISSTVEPFVGWRNYDLYLANNNRISDLQIYSNRSVMLSFEVSQGGEIKNITIDKSQGQELDAEAIRLLKEGPKWKVKKNGEKGKVEVKF